MLEMPEPWDACREKLLTGNGTSPRKERSWRYDMAIQSLEFSQLFLSLVLAQYFLTMHPSLCFGTVIYNLLHYSLEIYDLFVFLF